MVIQSLFFKKKLIIRPSIPKQFKITYYYVLSTFWLAPPIFVDENAAMNYPRYSVVGAMNPVILEAKYGVETRWASDATSKFTKWVCQAPRNGRFHGASPGWNNLFGNPAPNKTKQIQLTYLHQIIFTKDIDARVTGRKNTKFREAIHIHFPSNNEEAYPLILSVKYGTDTKKIDVTSQFLKIFVDNAKVTGRISGNFQWRNYFGDPAYVFFCFNIQVQEFQN
jgi:hypothetical protein